MYNAVIRYLEDFYGASVIPVTASATAVPWCKREVKTNGTTSLQGVTGMTCGGLEGTVSNTNEALAVELYHGDILSFLADNIQTIAMRLESVANVAAVEDLYFGMQSAANNNPTNTTYHTQFHLHGSNALTVESSDNATINNTIATDTTIVAGSMMEFMIDFREGLSDIRFYSGNANGKLHRLAKATTFAAPNLTGQCLQPFVFFGKSGGVTTPAFIIDYAEILLKRS